MPLYFGNINTARVEYRVHSGTTNKYKGIIWTMLCTAITKFAENNAIRILTSREKITLEDIVDEMFEQPIAQYIKEYIKFRTAENTSSLIANGDTEIYGNEFNKDNDFEFKTKLNNPSGRRSTFDIFDMK